MTGACCAVFYTLRAEATGSAVSRNSNSARGVCCLLQHAVHHLPLHTNTCHCTQPPAATHCFDFRLCSDIKQMHGTHVHVLTKYLVKPLQNPVDINSSCLSKLPTALKVHPLMIEKHCSIYMYIMTSLLFVQNTLVTHLSRSQPCTQHAADATRCNGSLLLCSMVL